MVFARRLRLTINVCIFRDLEYQFICSEIVHCCLFFATHIGIQKLGT